MDYSGYSSSWNNATAESVANGYYATVLAGVAQTGWPALNTEGGTDPLCSGICAPDTNLSGSAHYTTTTLHFIQTLTSLYDNAPQRISWVWWPAGSWTDTTNAGIYGAMQCASRPVGWGCLLNIKPVNNLQPLTANFSRTPLNPVVGTITAFNATASNGTAPFTFTWAFGDGSTGIGSTVTHAYSSAGTFTVVLTAKDSGSLQPILSSNRTDDHVHSVSVRWNTRLRFQLEFWRQLNRNGCKCDSQLLICGNIRSDSYSEGQWLAPADSDLPTGVTGNKSTSTLDH